MSNENDNVQHRDLFAARVRLDESITAQRATEKVMIERLTEMGKLQIQLEIATQKLDAIRSEYNNVVERADSLKDSYEEKIRNMLEAHQGEVTALTLRINELQQTIQEFPESPAERLVASVLDTALTRIHNVVLYFAATTLNTNRQSIAGKEFAELSIQRWPHLFSELTVKEKQLVRENIRTYVQSELSLHWECSAIIDVINAMNASPASWKTFQNLADQYSSSLIKLVARNEQFDIAVNAVVEFILEQLK